MNFLAHLYLADDTPASRVGNLMPDLVRGRLPADLPAEVMEGVRRHRRIDAFTDTHPLFARSRDRLRPRHGRFAGILVDIFYDHLLAADWASWHPRTLPAFSAEVYDSFAGAGHLMPERMRRIVERIADQDRLGSYARVSGIEDVLVRMSRRLTERFRRPVHLERAMDELRAHRDELAGDFAGFFPQLIAYAHPARQRPCRSARCGASANEQAGPIPGAALRSAPA
ncbi:MAG: ACP phosphodiesterase [Phycisphaeraceae bacterium]